MRDWLNNPEFRAFCDSLSPQQKTVLTGVCALGAAVVVGTLALPIALLAIGPLFGLGFWQLLAGILIAYGGAGWLFLVNGAYVLQTTEQATGGLFQQFTDWILPPGLSWWVPRLLGGSIETPLPITALDTKLSTDVGHEFLNVEGIDGARNSVRVQARLFINDFRKVRLNPNFRNDADAIFERHVRFFGSHFPSDPGLPDSLVQQKSPFTEYLMGAKGIKTPRWIGEDAQGNLVTTEPKVLENDILEKLEGIGLRLDWAAVPRINGPDSLSKAREERERERAERAKEMDNIRTRKRVARELLDGDDGLEISDDRALDAAELAAGDRTIIQVDGTAGDFTKGNLGAAAYGQRRPRS